MVFLKALGDNRGVKLFTLEEAWVDVQGIGSKIGVKTFYGESKSQYVKATYLGFE